MNEVCLSKFLSTISPSISLPLKCAHATNIQSFLNCALFVGKRCTKVKVCFLLFVGLSLFSCWFIFCCSVFWISVAPIKASFVSRVGRRKTGPSLISLLNIGWPLNNYTSGCTGSLWIFSIYLYFDLFVFLGNIIRWNFVFQCTFYVIYINKMLFFILLNCLIEIDCLVIWCT